MDASQLFPSPYLKAADVPTPRVLTVSGCQLEAMPDGREKPAISFVEETRKLILNKINTASLIALCGSETDHWPGQLIELFIEHCTGPQGLTLGIRIRKPQQALPPTAAIDWGQ